MAQGDTVHKAEGEKSAKSTSDAQPSSPVHSGAGFDDKSTSEARSLDARTLHKGSGKITKGGAKYGS